MIGDVAVVHAFTFIAVMVIVVLIFPLFLESRISAGIARLKRVPIYGRTVGAKWTNLVARVTSPWILFFCGYRHDQAYWSIWCYIVRIVLMFVSGVETFDTFVILSSVINGLYFFTMLLWKPHLSFMNYAYDLFTTFLSFIFPIIYQQLPDRPVYASAFPLAALIIGAIFFIISLILEMCPRHESPYMDKSRQPSWEIWRASANSDMVNPLALDDAELALDGRPIDAGLVTINDIDLRDIEELESNVSNNNFGEEIRVNQNQLYRLTSVMMEAVSLSCTWDDVETTFRIGILVIGVVFGAAGWYFGAVAGIHSERLSVNC
jgi:preprotein translocase subunit SecG